MNRLESTVKDIHEGLTINATPDDWNRTAAAMVAEIDRLRAELAECRAEKEALTPAAIVRLTGMRLVLFDDKEVAVQFYKKTDEADEIFVHPDTDIAWHPAGDPDAAAKPIWRHMEKLERELAECRAALSEIAEGLEWMAGFDWDTLLVARTLHYDMAAKAGHLLQVARRVSTPNATVKPIS